MEKFERHQLVASLLSISALWDDDKKEYLNIRLAINLIDDQAKEIEREKEISQSFGEENADLKEKIDRIREEEENLKVILNHLDPESDLYNTLNRIISIEV